MTSVRGGLRGSETPSTPDVDIAARGEQLLGGESQDSFQIGALVRRWWQLLVAGLVFGAALGAVVVGSLEPVHEMTVEVLVGPVVPDADVLEGAADLARTYGEVVESRQLVVDAAAAAGVSPSSVDVAAEAGRGSATLTITVQTASRSATPVVAAAVLDQLAEVVEASSPDLAPLLPPNFADGGELDLSEAFPSGSPVVVIDDGGGLVSERSLGIPVGAAAGGLAVTMVVASAILAVEQRRRLDPAGAIAAAIAGHDLGEVAIPSWREDLRYRWTGLSVGGSPAAGVSRLGDELVALPGEEATIVLVTAPTADRDHVRALLQVVRSIDEPPLIIDPEVVVAAALGVDHLLPGVVLDVRSNETMLTHLLVPRPDQASSVISERDARDVCRQMAGDVSVVLVFVPASSPTRVWRFWAAGADHAAIIIRRRDLAERLRPLTDRVRAAVPSLLGAIRVRRRWILGRTQPLDLVIPHKDRNRRRPAPDEQPAPAP